MLWGVSFYGEDGTITRGQWLHNLVVIFDMSVDDDNMPDEYFKDITPDNEYYRDIMTAAEFGVVAIPAGGNVESEKNVTRGFAAQTLNFCLGFRLEEEMYTFKDSDEITDEESKNAAQIAVNRGWMSLKNGNFSSESVVTTDEVRTMIDDVKSILRTTEINENHKNIYEFAEDVIVVPEETGIHLDKNDRITIYDTSLRISDGDIFAIYLNGIPQIYTAERVVAENNSLSITTSKADEEKLLKNADAQGIADGNLALVQPEDGISITYIEGGTAEAKYEDGTEYYDARIAGTKNISAVNLNGSIGIAKGVNINIGCTLSNLKVKYKVVSKNHEAYVSCSGNVFLTGNLTVDFFDASGISKRVLLGSIPVGNIGFINVYAVAGADGSLTVTYTTNLEAGVQYSESMGFRLIKNFKKSTYSLQSQINMKLGVQVEASLNVPCVNGQIYAEAGAQGQYKAITYGDGELPATCATFRGWMYANVGASLTIDYGIGKKSFGKNIDIYTFDNSPVRLVYHWEDKLRVQTCSRDSSDRWYTTGFSSRYGSPGDGYEFNEEGRLVPVFRYEVYKNDKEKEVARITGYTGDAYALTIPSEIDGYTVESIGSNAFCNRSNLYIVSIPEIVTHIGMNAFSECPLLSQINIPDSVTEIGSWAFARCENLINVKLSRSLETLGVSAFGGCVKIGKIEIPKSLKKTTRGYRPDFLNGADRGAFMGCDGLKEVTFETGTTKIADGLFGYCSGLTDIIIPETVTTIEDEAFCHCKNLKDVVIPNSVTKIGASAFESCGALKEITIPDSVTEIGSWAFTGCGNLTHVKLSKSLEILGVSAFGGCVKIGKIEIPKSLEKTTLGYRPDFLNGADRGAFMGCDGLKEVTFEKGTTKIADGLFGYCSGLTDIIIPETVTTIEDNAFYHCKNLKDVVIPNNVTKIGFDAFAFCSMLEEITVPDSVTEISGWAFARCENLTNVKLSKSLEILGVSAFGGCVKIEKIEIPKSLKETTRGFDPDFLNGADRGAFMGCDGLKEVTFETGTTKIADGLFGYCSGLVNITIPETVSIIEGSAFYHCENLTDIMIPNSVMEIGNSSFSRCTNLKEIRFPGSVETIKAAAFENTGLIEIEIPESVTKIGEAAFKGNTSLNKVTVKDSPLVIGGECFQNCTALENVLLGNGIQEIGKAAFSGCSKLTSIRLPDSVRSIGEQCFSNNDLLSDVKLGNKLTVIPKSAFYQCGALKEIILPYGVTEIKNNAFINCTSLSEITIPRKTTIIADAVFSYPDKITIYGVAGTYAETYAKDKNMKFISKEVKAKSAVLIPELLTLKRYSTTALTLSIEPDNFTDEVFWKSTNPNIVAVTDTGIITAKKAGEANIMVNVGDVSASCAVTVLQPVESLYLSETSLIMEALDTYQLEAGVWPEDAYNKETEWSSSDEKIASVDENGKVMAHKKGTADIMVKAKDGGNVSATCTVTVSNNAHIVTSVNEMESSHNYTNNCSDYWVYTASDDVEALHVTFDKKTETEKDFDFIYIYTADNIEVGKYTGTELSGKTIRVPGNTVKIKLVADDGGTAWGFKVESITPGAEKLPQMISGTGTYDKTIGDDSFKLDAVVTDGDGILSYVSDNPSIASVDEEGNVTIQNIGTVHINVTASATDNYKSAEFIIVLTVRDKEEIGKKLAEIAVIEQTYEIPYSDEIFLLDIATNSDGRIIYQVKGDAVSISGEGIVSLNKPGNAMVTVNTAETKEYFASKEKSISITVTQGTLPNSAPLAEKPVKKEITKIRDVVLEEGWVWAEEDVDKMIEFGEAVSATAYYNGTDKAYYAITNKEVTLTSVDCNHDITGIQSQKEESCFEKGYTGDVYCTNCKYVLSAGKNIPKTVHHWDHGTVTKDSTCISDGERTFTCSNCMLAIMSAISADSSKHIIKTIKGKEATCTQTGLTDGSECTECGAVIVAQKEKPAKGHIFNSWTVTKSATAVSTGTRQRVCTKCDSKETQMIARLKATGKLNMTKIPLKVRQSTTQFKVTDLATGDKVRSYKTTNPKVASVNAKGKITAKKKGTTTLKVILESGKVLTAKIIVQKGTVKTAKLTVNRKNVTLKKGKSYKTQVTLMPLTSQQKITYSTSNRKIAKVNTKGVIKAIKKGSATITVKSGSKKTKIKIKVK